MTSNWAAWALLTLALTLGVSVALQRRRAVLADRMERASRPSDLRDAELIYLEERFNTSDPVRLSARLDRAYRMPSGLVVLLELKTRSVNRVYPSDVIQLSAQRLALERKTGQVVAHHGYVVAQMPDGARKVHRVQLVSGEAVVALVRRRETIRRDIACVSDPAQQVPSTRAGRGSLRGQSQGVEGEISGVFMNALDPGVLSLAA